MKKYLETEWDLKERLHRLPKDVYDTMYKDFESYSTSSTARKRWHQVLRGEVDKVYHYELAVICEHVGCTIFDIMDPTEDLLEIYLEKYRREEEAYAKEMYGLSKPKKDDS